MFALVLILNSAQQRKGKQSEGSERQVSQILGCSISLFPIISKESLLFFWLKISVLVQTIHSLLLTQLQQISVTCCNHMAFCLHLLMYMLAFPHSLIN